MIAKKDRLTRAYERLEMWPTTHGWKIGTYHAPGFGIVKIFVGDDYTILDVTFHSHRVTRDIDRAYSNRYLPRLCRLFIADVLAGEIGK